MHKVIDRTNELTDDRNSGKSQSSGSRSVGHMSKEADSETDTAENRISDDELSQMQHEKIASIRAAIAAGAYDSDDLLEKALTRMLQQMEDPEDLQ